MSRGWITVKWSDIPEDNEPYKFIPHHLITTKKWPWPVRCKYCGLMILNNRFSLWAKRAGCENRKHPDYKREWRATSEPLPRR